MEVTRLILWFCGVQILHERQWKLSLLNCKKPRSPKGFYEGSKYF